MSNMDYCRFENTLQDLHECNKHINDTDLSDTEKRARLFLILLCAKIAGRYCDLKLPLNSK
jgi:hypothetical protein